MRIHRLLLPALLLALVGRAAADEVTLTGGTRLTGVVVARDESQVRLLLPTGQELALAAADVREVSVDPDAPAGAKVTRFRSGAQHAQEGLQVALIHLRHPETGRRVDLVGAVHMADAAYFREVQRLLEAADVVLYELVRPKDGTPEPEDAPPHPLRAFQQRLAAWFGFAFQMDAISYDRPHFVHADMTMEELMAAGRAPAPAEPAPQLPAILEGLGDQVKMLERMFAPLDGGDPAKAAKSRRRMKRMFGGLLGAMGPQAMKLLGEEASELLLTRRNEVAIERLKALPPEPRNVAIFYGAAHLPDLEQRLLALGYRRLGARWLLAWDLREEPAVAR